MTKKKRGRRVEEKDASGADGWERIGVKAAASSTRLPHSSYFSLRQAGGRVDRQRSKTTGSLLLMSKIMCFAKDFSTSERFWEKSNGAGCCFFYLFISPACPPTGDNWPLALSQ